MEPLYVKTYRKWESLSVDLLPQIVDVTAVMFFTFALTISV